MPCPIGADKCEEVTYGKGDDVIQACPFQKEGLCDYPHIVEAEKRQQVLVPDYLLTEIKDREYAESLTGEVGVRLHFGISWAEMKYHRHRRDAEVEAEIWQFSNKPFIGAVKIEKVSS